MLDGSAPVPSPCTGVCRLDPGTQHCDGCARTIDEIAAWSRLDDSARQAVIDALPARRRGLLARLPTTPTPNHPCP